MRLIPFYILLAGLSVLCTSFVKRVVNDGCQVYDPYHKFANILSNPKYSCYGQPSERPRKMRCNIPSCGKTYYLQNFCKKGQYTTTFYHSSTDCEVSQSGYHSNQYVNIVAPCSCDDNINIGSGWD
ncbi:MAG: hypothetical protein AAGG75_09880 [Bacteroidota bacterium]